MPNYGIMERACLYVLRTQASLESNCFLSDLFVMQLATLTEHGKQLIGDQHFEAKNVQKTLAAVTDR